MKDIGILRITTESQFITMTIPGLTSPDEIDELLQRARFEAESDKEGVVFRRKPQFTFIFPTEKVRIFQDLISIQSFVKKDNYVFDTPDVRVTNR